MTITRHILVKLIGVFMIGLCLVEIQAQSVTDIEGNIYKTVTIGNQTWMAENLKTTKYNDGMAIPLVADNAAWTNRDSIALTNPAFYWYNNDSTYKNTYGALYNGYAVKTGKLCPTGWHVPTDTEWSELTTYLGGEDVAGGKLKESGTSHWESPNYGATNESGFNALPGGYRSMDGIFNIINNGGSWWTSTDFNTERIWIRGMNTNIELVFKGPAEKPGGLSVRCLKD